MQRRTSVLLIKGVFGAGQRRPLNGPAGATTAAVSSTPVTAAPHQAAAVRPTTATATTTTTTSGQHVSVARPASLVTPPSNSATSPGVVTGVKKKKIIRRIIKRKKMSAEPAGGVAAHSAESAAVEATSQGVAQSAEPAVPIEVEPIATPSSPLPRRGLAILNEIRKQPEGAIREIPRVAVEEKSSQQAAASAEQYRPYAPDRHTGGSEEPDEAHKQNYADDLDNEKAPSHMCETASAEAEANGDARSDDVYSAIFNSNSSSSTCKTPMVKGYRIDEVSAQCSTSDAMFARRLPAGGCQFFAWPGTPLSVASSAIVSMPDTIRTVHAVFGRVGAPIDIVMDIDCQVPQEYWHMSKIRFFQRKVLDEVLGPLKEEIEKIGERIETQVVLQSPNLKKASFHVHTRLKDAAFSDFYSLYGFLSRFQERLPNVDLQIYRPNGMLRMFSCMKENHTSAMVVFDEPKWNIGFPDGKVSDEQAALHSICVRDPSTFSRLLTFEAPRQYQMPAYGGSKGRTESDNSEGSSRPPVVLLPRTEREAIDTASGWLRQATEAEVGEWRTWIGLGLCAFRIGYQFRNAKNLSRPAMEEMLDAWTEASRKCPLKFHGGECEARWATFDPHKIGISSDWWAAYRRLGRLEVPMREAMEREAAAAALRERKRQDPPIIEVPAVSEPQSAATGVTSALRKMKRHKKMFRRE